MNYEERRLKIVMWTVVALLILSIAGASLLFIMKLRTPSTRLNTVNIGSRITGRGGFKSNLTNADVWDGTSADTVFAGSGTESSPYLITSAAEFYGLSKRINNGESFKDKYVYLITFKMLIPICENNQKYFLLYFCQYPRLSQVLLCLHFLFFQKT